MPAEWEPHAATWVAWPHQQDDWPGKFEAIPWVYTEIVRLLSQSEPVKILVHNELAVRATLEKQNPDWSRITLIPLQTNRSWIRDYGPIFVRDEDGRQTVLDWQFNAWAKYDNWDADNRVTQQLAKLLDWRVSSPVAKGKRVVLEGGSIDVNGQGLLLTTEECLLSPVQARNPDFTRFEIEQVFADYLGVEKVLWLGRGIEGDDTHGHVDDLARFVSEDCIVTVVEKDESDPNYEPLRENLERLQGMTDLAGEKLEIVPLPMPNPVFFDGQRLPASYANFYVANTTVLVPTFNDPNDRAALGRLQDLFPDRKVIGIHSVDLVWGFGTLHCLTQQQPLAS